MTHRNQKKIHPLGLTRDELSSAVWKKIVNHLEKRLEILRKINDNKAHKKSATNRIRGRISEIKKILNYEGDKDD